MISASGSYPILEIGKGVHAEDPRGRHLAQLDHRRRDDAERPFGADQHLREFRASGMTRDGRRMHQLARRRDEFEAEDMIDLAVLGRQHA